MQMIRFLLVTAIFVISFEDSPAQPPPAPVNHDRRSDETGAVTDTRQRNQIDSAFDHLDQLQSAGELPKGARWKPIGDGSYRLDSLTHPTATLVAFGDAIHHVQFGFLSSDAKAHDCHDGKRSSGRKTISVDKESIHLIESCASHHLIWIPENREQEYKLDRLMRGKLQSFVIDGHRVSFDFSGTDLMMAALDVARANQAK
ncbi:hypothetical protein [Pinirhizobacter soli]|uniref:hypothetical protein n=1 Tax=Pinirhizobacter soli TaxID=2786953 RepID=UPI002029D1D5|nr:hypothetical protein [Pinirhizobacter soli]